MNSFRNHRLRDLTLPTSTAGLLTDIAEAKSRQELYPPQSPQILKALRDTAIIQSAESSNRRGAHAPRVQRLTPRQPLGGVSTPVPPLIAAAALVLDFICIHPFRDGNGRVSRLLTLLALYQHGYEVGRYLSLERLTEESKEDYYEALQRSSQRWHEGKHDLTPWLNFFLAIIRRASAEFEQRAGQLMKIDVLDHSIILSKRLDNTIYAERRIIPSW